MVLQVLLGIHFAYDILTVRCWVRAHYDLYRFVLHYLWIFLIIVIMATVYSWIAFKIYTIKKNADTDNLAWRRLLKKLAGYPIAFTVVFAPLGNIVLIVFILTNCLGICRIAAWAGRSVSEEALIFSMCIFALNGLINAVVYGYTRSVFRNYAVFFGNKAITNSSSVINVEENKKTISVS